MTLDKPNEGQPDAPVPVLWQGEQHPYAGVQPGDNIVRTAIGAQLDIPPLEEFKGIPQPIQKAVKEGTPIRFSSAGENAEAGRQPDFFLTTEGELVPNPKATPSPDGSLNIEIQTKEAEHSKTLTDAILHENAMQKAKAEEMIRLFQKNHPGQEVPAWMNALANAEPNLPAFVPFPTREAQPVTAPPENGFVNRGVAPGGGGGGGGGGGRPAGTSGYAGNGGFDSSGMFKGNGSKGDGTVSLPSFDGKGKPLEGGQKVAAKEIYDYLTEHHKVDPVIASAMLGNMQTESSFRTDAYNKAEGAIGLIQWEGGRDDDLRRFAAAQGKSPTEWKVQVDFMMHELTEGKEQAAWAKIQAAERTPAAVAAAFDKYYERSAGTSRGERMANAENIYKTIATA